ncbi:MAG: CDP-alcohol phosphatidyltransferase family protein [Candidatus Puniceispirillaceae bacterium]
MPVPKRRPFRFQVSANWMIPNIITIAALVSGLTALRFALNGQWDMVVGLITLGAIFDALDGRTARLLRATSAFGGALDSLSDVVVFGVVPGLCLYLWALQDLGNIAWATALFYIVCIALRLARFDSEIPDKPDFAKNFFTGIPSPAAGLLVLLPIVIHNQFEIEMMRQAFPVSLILVICGVAAVSTMPTFAGKSFKISSDFALPILALIALLTGLVVAQPWLAYILITVLYLGSIPFAIIAFMRQKQRHKSAN